MKASFKLLVLLYPCSKESSTPTLLDEAEQEKRLAERQKLFKDDRDARQAVLELRNEDRQRRNEAKLKQLETAEQWQASYYYYRRAMVCIV